jgi:hypothetical protein
MPSDTLEVAEVRLHIPDRPPLQALEKVLYGAVQFRESLRSALSSATTRDRARHPYARISSRHWN